MSPDEDGTRLVRNTALVVVALVVLRLVAAAWTPLTFDEAYYWIWSKNLAFGYYDHPPGRSAGDPSRHHDRRRHRTWRAAGVDPAGAADELCRLSHGRNSVRRQAAGGQRCHSSECNLDGSDRHADRDAGFAAPGRVQLCAVLISPRCWRAAAAHGGSRSGPPRALALVSKYTAMFFGPAILIWLISVPRLRRWLFSPWLYLGGLVALDRLFSGHSLERRSRLGFLHQAAWPRRGHGFQARRSLAS